MVDMTAFATVVVVFGLSYLLRKATHRTFQFPSPKGIPFLGNIFQINLYRYTDAFTNWHKQLGDTIECFFMHYTYIDSIDHTVVSQVLHNNARDDLYKYTLTDVMGKNSVIIIDGPAWKKQRNLLSTNFTTLALQSMMNNTPEKLTVPAQHMVNRLKSVMNTGTPVEMDHEFERVSLAVVGNTVFNYDFGYSEAKLGDPETPLLKELWLGMDEYNKRMVDPLRKYINPYSIWRFSRTMRIIKALVREKICDRIACQNLNSQGVKYDDSLGVMLDAYGAEDPEKSLSYPELQDNVVTLLLAGHETTGHALSFACYEVASNPEVEKRVIEALDAIGDRDITYDDLQQGGALKYIGWVIHETMRMHPVAASILRKWHAGQQLGKDHIAAQDCNVGVTLPMLHMDERVWPNPDVFDPTRFDEDIEENKNRPVTSYLPFGGGPRTCIGKKLALLELKYMLATMYRNFVFRKVPNHKYDIEITVTMHEVDGMPLLIQSRA